MVINTLNNKSYFTFPNFEVNVSDNFDRNIVFGNLQIKLKTIYFYKGTNTLFECLLVHTYISIYIQTFIKKRISIEFVFFTLKNGNLSVNI